MATPTPIQISIPADLKKYCIPLQEFLEMHPTYTNLAVGSLIFIPETTTNNTRLLLVQRASTDHAFPDLWEVPGGSSSLSDPAILHSAARETFEKTGLRLTRVVREVAPGVEFTTSGEKTWLKLSFEIEVAEIHGNGLHEMGLGEMMGHVRDGEHTDSDEEAWDPSWDVEIRLDPEEHQAYAWVEEQEVVLDRFPIVTPEQEGVILDAFAWRKTENNRLKALAEAALGERPVAEDPLADGAAAEASLAGDTPTDDASATEGDPLCGSTTTPLATTA